MTEKYFIEDNNEMVIKFGHFVEKVFAKHIHNYGEENANKTRERVKNIYRNCVEQVQSTSSNRNILLIGKVQSGKTSNLEMFTALAFDNGYKCVIIYGGYDLKLLAQTSERFRKTFDVSDDGPESEEPELFSTNDSTSVDALDEGILNKIIGLNKPIIFVSMKRPSALRKINTVLSKVSDRSLPSFIIDDEGDQASLNTEFKKSKDSATYKEIDNMKRILNIPLYLSVTATPQANVLLGEYSSLKPDKLFLIEPGNGYTGAEFFHLDEEHIITVSDDNIEEQESQDVIQSVNYFLIASAIMKTKSYKYTDMIIHNSRTNKAHAELYSLVYAYIQSLNENIKNNDNELEIQLKEIERSYNAELFSDEFIGKINFENIKDDIKGVIQETHIILQDGQGKITQGNEKYREHKIYIGGDLLQRGLTFKNLITTYFTRWPKHAGNMDTTIQRARWLGYRSKYLELCKIFTTSKIQKEYSALTESENDLWEQCHYIEQGKMTISDIVIDADSSTLNPTRKNVVNYKSVKFNRKWINQNTGCFNREINLNNNKVIDSFLNKLSLQPSSVGRIGEAKPSCFYAYANEADVTQLVNDVNYIFECDPFNKKDLLNVVKKYKIVVQKMFELKGPTDDARLRTFDSSNCKISFLQQGPDQAEKALQHYQGDSYVIVDEDALTIQIFKITPRFKKEMPLKEHNQYMFSIHIPECRKVFIKNEFRRKD